MIKKLASIAAFSILLGLLFSLTSETLTLKDENRYFILEKNLEELKENYDVQVYGSCHAYTSFDSKYFTDNHGITSFNLSNPCEIIPVTYLRMKEHFKNDPPQIALVETWGLNPYETYLDPDSIFYPYMRANIERLPLSLEKIKVILDFSSLRLLDENLPIVTYKDRLLEGSLTAPDISYSYELLKSTYESSIYYTEMDLRLSNQGFKPYPSTPLPDYTRQQAKIAIGEELAVEKRMMKYVDKIIQLCNENEVKLIFYRAPYRASANELKKANYLRIYLSQQEIPYFNLEQEIAWDYQTDFFDYEHLSAVGAQKVTEYLSEHILNFSN